MTGVEFQIDAWAAWLPRLSLSLPETSDAPALLRRRVSPIGQKALAAAWGLPNLAESRFVLASRHGEFGRTLSILDSIAADEIMSPADFSLSVHHALAGLLAMATHDGRGHVALGAGAESFGYGLLEAAACLADDPSEPVVLLAFDEPPPAPFDRFNDAGEETVAAAFALSRGSSGNRISLRFSPTGSDEPSDASQIETFLRFLEGDEARARHVGARLSWDWSRHG